MSSIDALDITGVRAFGSRTQRIRIAKPLTLIVGQNGSGKTTIIECLKYVTTGVMPPTTAQAGFLHDPNLKGDKQTLAKITVVISTAAQAQITCARRMSVTIQKGSLSYKSLENTCKVERDGEDVSDAVLRTELDVQIPAWLGVSRAVLDRVIFCHQDDSLWPLDTAKKVKDHFDVLFEADKYAKAIAQIKILRKQQMDNLKVFKNEVIHQRTNKENGATIQKRCQSLNKEIEALRAEATKLSESLREAQKKSEDASVRANKAGEVVGQLNGKRIELRTKQESVDSLRQTMQELEDSDKVLEDLLAQYEERTKAFEEERSAKRDQYEEMQKQLIDTRGAVNDKSTECGSYEAQYVHHQRRITERKTLIKETANQHAIRGFDLELSDEQVLAFVDRINKMARDQNATLERARREAQEELRKEQSVLSDISERKSAFMARKDNARQQMTSNDRRIDSLHQELGNINVDEGDKFALQSNLDSTEAQLQTARTGLEEANWQQQITSVEADLRQLEDRKQRVEDELVEATRTAGDSAQLDFAQKELKDRQQRLQTVVSAHKARLNAIVGEEWQQSTIGQVFRTAQDHAASRLADAEKQRDGCNREMEQLDHELSKCRSDLAEHTTAVAKAASMIDRVVEGGPKEYHTELRQLEESREIVKADADSFKLMLDYLDQCIKDAERHKVCRTCTRALSKDKDMDALRRNIEKQRQNFQLGQASSDLESVEKQLEDMRAVAGQYEIWDRLSQQVIPALKIQQQTLESQRVEVLARLEVHDTQVGDQKDSQRDVESISKTVASIVKYNADTNDFELSMKDLTVRLHATGMPRGLEVIQDENAKMNTEKRVLQDKLDYARKEKEKLDKQVNMLELSFREIQTKASNVNAQLRERLALDTQIAELKTSNAELRQRIADVDQGLQGLNGELPEAQARYDEVAARSEARERQLQADAKKLDDSCNELKLANKDIQAYTDRDGPALLESARQEVQRLKTEVTELESQQVKTGRELRTLEEHLRNHDETRRNVVDNLRYRRDLRALQSVKAEIQELETHDAEEERERYAQEREVWQKKSSNLSGERDTIIGECKGKDGELAHLIETHELQYKNAAEMFRKAQIDVATTEACAKDLDKYGAALDKAIMKFHSIKMEEINRVIDELWRKTYQGTDVDTIYIRSDAEGKGNRAYNYRVCMLKQQTEMDMRGRCSAGQKVLACIIIRLALAECFGVNCGLIALDEPTTNLDRDNIQALATSLGELINVRQAQRNFQLIVITHDEDFLKCMQPSNYVDDYYRVGRDINQESYIKRESIHTLMR